MRFALVSRRDPAQMLRIMQIDPNLGAEQMLFAVDVVMPPAESVFRGSSLRWLIVLGLIASRRMRHRWLPVVMGLIIVGWIALAHDFFDAHPDLLRVRLSRRNVNAAGASDNYFDFSQISKGGHLVQVITERVMESLAGAGV